MWTVIWLNWAICVIMSLCALLGNSWVVLQCLAYLMNRLKSNVVLRMMRAARDSSCWQRCRVNPSSMWPSVCRHALRGQGEKEQETLPWDNTGKRKGKNQKKNAEATMSGTQVLTLQAIWLSVYMEDTLSRTLLRAHLYHFCHSSQGTRFIFSWGRDLTDNHLNLINSLPSK